MHAERRDDAVRGDDAREVQIDPALAGRELGSWTMVPPATSVPAAIALAALLLWYFRRLGRKDVPATRRRLRRASIVFALVGIVPLVRVLSFVHPHADRVGWALMWSAVLLALLGWALLAVIDVILVARSGMREYAALEREFLRRPGADEAAPDAARAASVPEPRDG